MGFPSHASATTTWAEPTEAEKLAAGPSPVAPFIERLRHDKAMLAIIERLNSPHADKVYVAKGYTKADLRRDLEALS